MNAWENVLLQGLMPALHNQKCTPKPSALHAPGDAYPVCIIRHQLIRLYDYRTGGLPPIIMLLRISQCFHRRLVKPRIIRDIIPCYHIVLWWVGGCWTLIQFCCVCLLENVQTCNFELIVRGCLLYLWHFSILKLNANILYNVYVSNKTTFLIGHSRKITCLNLMITVILSAKNPVLQQTRDKLRFFCYRAGFRMQK